MAHRAYGIYAHITWHTRLRQRCMRRAEAGNIVDAVREAAARLDVHVRGYFVESLSRSHLSTACVYVAGQHKRHPDRIPA